MEAGKKGILFKLNFEMCYKSNFFHNTVTKTITFKGKLEEIFVPVDLNLHATVPEVKWQKGTRIRKQKL